VRSRPGAVQISAGGRSCKSTYKSLPASNARPPGCQTGCPARQNKKKLPQRQKLKINRGLLLRATARSPREKRLKIAREFGRPHHRRPPRPGEWAAHCGIPLSQPNDRPQRPTATVEQVRPDSKGKGRAVHRCPVTPLTTHPRRRASPGQGPAVFAGPSGDDVVFGNGRRMAHTALSPSTGMSQTYDLWDVGNACIVPALGGVVRPPGRECTPHNMSTIGARSRVRRRTRQCP
jgi:hypothetical protein